MGINHDNDHPSCADGLHIMSGEWIKGQNLGDVSWSRCSKEDLERFLRYWGHLLLLYHECLCVPASSTTLVCGTAEWKGHGLGIKALVSNPGSWCQLGHIIQPTRFLVSTFSNKRLGNMICKAENYCNDKKCCIILNCLFRNSQWKTFSMLIPLHLLLSKTSLTKALPFCFVVLNSWVFFH